MRRILLIQLIINDQILDFLLRKNNFFIQNKRFIKLQQTKHELIC